jgi:hypothetical protein
MNSVLPPKGQAVLALNGVVSQSARQCIFLPMRAMAITIAPDPNEGNNYLGPSPVISG